MHLTDAQQQEGRRNFLKAVADTRSLAELTGALGTRGPKRGGPVKIGLRVSEPLGERQWIAGFDQHVEAPGLDLLALRLGIFDRLGHGERCFAFPRSNPATS